ncbi:hypothetical protein FM104_12650 [Microbacterium esteraromaticum]|uniref:Uncharacterized protein n=1 Tax=Microbacterium esteraromaticum TaxID=57043 RepID=A0A1R4KHA3_9MICO|nr:hypothetical protein [Microbacterium esteraromaticum]SJN43433.1 hypothetical protein FM104_12650 [Microbacterium esteraromaticum]
MTSTSEQEITLALTELDLNGRQYKVPRAALVTYLNAVYPGVSVDRNVLARAEQAFLGEFTELADVARAITEQITPDDAGAFLDRWPFKKHLDWTAAGADIPGITSFIPDGAIASTSALICIDGRYWFDRR